MDSVGRRRRSGSRAGKRARGEPGRHRRRRRERRAFRHLERRGGIGASLDRRPRRRGGPPRPRVSFAAPAVSIVVSVVVSIVVSVAAVKLVVLLQQHLILLLLALIPRGVAVVVAPARDGCGTRHPATAAADLAQEHARAARRGKLGTAPESMVGPVSEPRGGDAESGDALGRVVHAGGLGSDAGVDGALEPRQRGEHLPAAGVGLPSGIVRVEGDEGFLHLALLAPRVPSRVGRGAVPRVAVPAKVERGEAAYVADALAVDGELPYELDDIRSALAHRVPQDKRHREYGQHLLQE
mmetsp:Transcript_3208/g.12641  ORF Transcript_3208/g.12641 Transcript_3208/m.12641 type:complete len:296 (+) Transcript_3208:2088-2975(+)